MSDFLRGHRCDERVSSRHEVGGGRDVPGKKEMTRKASSPKRFEPACSARSMPARRRSGKKREIKYNFRSCRVPLFPRPHQPRNLETSTPRHAPELSRWPCMMPSVASTPRDDLASCQRAKGRVDPERFGCAFRENDVASAIFFGVETRQTRTTPKTRSKSPVH